MSDLCRINHHPNTVLTRFKKKIDIISQFPSRLLNPGDEFVKGGQHPAALAPAFGKPSLFAVVTKSSMGAFEILFVLWLLSNFKNLSLNR